MFNVARKERKNEWVNERKADAAAILIWHCFLPAARDSGLAKRQTGKILYHNERSISTGFSMQMVNAPDLGVGTLILWWLKPRLWLVDLNYNFECDWLIELQLGKWISGK